MPASRVEVDHRNRHVFSALTQTEKALLRAQCGLQEWHF